jgi:hypothetical protein
VIPNHSRYWTVLYYESKVCDLLHFFVSLRGKQLRNKTDNPETRQNKKLLDNNIQGVPELAPQRKQTNADDNLDSKNANEEQLMACIREL